MDQLEKTFLENKSSFDRLTPKPNLWNEISQKTKKKSAFTFWKNAKTLSIAASILILIGIFQLFNTKSAIDSNLVINIALASPSGEQINLSDVHEKITLVQFWASWSEDCSKENCYYFRPVYDKFKDKGFQIYAVSVDENKDAWLESISKDSLPWVHVSDLQGFDSPICKECNISEVPANFLLNEKGEIIAKNLDVEVLEATVTELLAVND